MKLVKIEDGQTMVDIAVQELGDPARCMELAILNDKGLTEDLVAGELVQVTDYDQDKRWLVTLFSLPANHPASSDKDGSDSEGLEGIGYWIVGNDFKVQ